jgi:hypothetical protein
MEWASLCDDNHRPGDAWSLQPKSQGQPISSSRPCAAKSLGPTVGGLKKRSRSARTLGDGIWRHEPVRKLNDAGARQRFGSLLPIGENPPPSLVRQGDTRGQWSAGGAPEAPPAAFVKGSCSQVDNESGSAAMCFTATACDRRLCHRHQRGRAIGVAPMSAHSNEDLPCGERRNLPSQGAPRTAYVSLRRPLVTVTTSVAALNPKSGTSAQAWRRSARAVPYRAAPLRTGISCGAAPAGRTAAETDGGALSMSRGWRPPP